MSCSLTVNLWTWVICNDQQIVTILIKILNTVTTMALTVLIYLQIIQKLKNRTLLKFLLYSNNEANANYTYNIHTISSFNYA